MGGSHVVGSGIPGALLDRIVKDRLADIAGIPPETLDTIQELAAAIGDNPEFAADLAATLAGITDALALLAPLDSPELEGTPQAPTADISESSEILATTGFVHAVLDAIGLGSAALHAAIDFATPADLSSAITALGLGSASTHAASDFATPASVANAIASLVNSSPSALDTLKELADALGDDPNFATTMTTALAGKATPANITAALLANLTSGLLASMPGTGTASKVLYFATDAGLYADLTNGAAYTKIGDLPGTAAGIELFRVTVGSLINITSTSVVALPSPGPATATVVLPAGVQGLKIKALIPKVSATVAATAVTLELFVDGVAVESVTRNIAATSDVFDGNMEYEHIAPSAGSHTYEVRGAVTGNTGKLVSFPVGNSVVLTGTTFRTS